MIKNNILAIETSCDDTCIAIISNGIIIKNIILSSAKLQNEYGGVVPEVAARAHEHNILSAFHDAVGGFDLKSLNYIAYTNNPGLRVCLNIGEIFAYSLSSMLQIPLIPINHIYAHIFSFYSDPKVNIHYPFISLVASGGHTSIFLVKSPIEIITLNETVDDAAGECYDKIARELKLGYPGGPEIDKLYDHNKKDVIQFIKKMPTADANLSFSGLKTSVLNYINQLNMQKKPIDIITVASSFQKTLMDIIFDKLHFYTNKYDIKAIAIGGGVSCNSYLQSRIKQEFNKLIIYIPEIKSLASDNAAMIGIYANLYLNNK